MKLFRYKNFIKESKGDIHSICEKYDIENYTINDDVSIDVDGDVNLCDKGLTELPLKFGKVSGNFYCNNNILTSLSGAPREVGGGFFCHDNKLTSLEGSPLEVGGYFSCRDNKLTSLEGSPREVGGDFSCGDNKLTSLEGSPREVGGNFYCHYNYLTNLEGSPHSVGGYFECSCNKLTSLEGISKYISVGIYCDNNKIRDVKGIKDGWRGTFYVEVNPVYQIFELFPIQRCDEVVEYLNEYEVIRDGKVVILQALELVFYEMGLEVPEIEHIKGYDIQF